MTRCDGRRKGSVPGADKFPVCFEVKLNAVARTADPECLVGGNGVACKPHGARRQGEGVVVPLEDGKFARQDAKHRIAGSGIRQGDMSPSELFGATDLVGCAIGTGQQLAAEANAEYGFVGLGKIAKQVEQDREPRGILVIKRILTAAQHDKSVVTIRGCRQAVTMMRATDIERGAGFLKRRTDLTQAGIIEVLDDNNPHPIQIPP